MHNRIKLLLVTCSDVTEKILLKGVGDSLPRNVMVEDAA